MVGLGFELEIQKAPKSWAFSHSPSVQEGVPWIQRNTGSSQYRQVPGGNALKCVQFPLKLLKRMMVLLTFNFGRHCFLNILPTFPILFSSFTQALSDDCSVDKFSVRLGLLCRLYLPSKGERIL